MERMKCNIWTRQNNEKKSILWLHKINIRDFRADILRNIRRCYLDSPTSAVSFPQRVIVGWTRSKEEEIPLSLGSFRLSRLFFPRNEEWNTLFRIFALVSFRNINVRKDLKLHNILRVGASVMHRTMFVVDENTCALYRSHCWLKDTHHGLRDATWPAETQLVILLNRWFPSSISVFYRVFKPGRFEIDLYLFAQFSYCRKLFHLLHNSRYIFPLTYFKDTYLDMYKNNNSRLHD